MGWYEVMQELESKVLGILAGTYRPLDNFRLFRLQYPPQEEREAIRQFIEFRERLISQGWQANILSLQEIFQDALVNLLGCKQDDLLAELVQIETTRDRLELQSQLSQHLPDELGRLIVHRLSDCSENNVSILLRMGCLYPFLRSSSIVSSLEGKTRCTLVLPYPGISLGALLDAPPVDLRGGYYRGESIAWR